MKDFQNPDQPSKLYANMFTHTHIFSNRRFYKKCDFIGF